MKQISGFSVVRINGGNRVSYTYDEIDNESGELISSNNRKSFYAVDQKLNEYIEYIRLFVNSREEN